MLTKPQNLEAELAQMSGLIGIRNCRAISY